MTGSAASGAEPRVHPAYLTHRLAARERLHRRLTGIAVAALLVMSTSPIFVHHAGEVGGSLLAGLDHVGALCLTALHLILVPVHRVFHLVLGAGVVYGLWDRARAWRRMRQTLGLLEARMPTQGDAYWIAARRAGVDPRVVRVVQGLPNPAFTVGWIFPRIFVAAALAARLGRAELSAVLAHEGAHVRRRDPLRLSLFRFVACTLFWIPALRSLADDMADDAEVLADDVAAEGRPLVLASAILALAEGQQAKTGLSGSASPFLRPSLTARRIRRLAGEDAAVGTHLTRRSTIAAAAALSVVWASGLLAAHPLATHESTGQTAHCAHHDRAPFEHLFCIGLSLTAPDGRCPHDVSELPHAPASTGVAGHH